MEILHSVLGLQNKLIHFLESKNFEMALNTNDEIEKKLIEYDLVKTNSESERNLLEIAIKNQEKIDILFEEALLEEKSEYFIFKNKVSLLKHFNPRLKNSFESLDV